MLLLRVLQLLSMTFNLRKVLGEQLQKYYYIKIVFVYVYVYVVLMRGVSVC